MIEVPTGYFETRKTFVPIKNTIFLNKCLMATLKDTWNYQDSSLWCCPKRDADKRLDIKIASVILDIFVTFQTKSLQTPNRILHKYQRLWSKSTVHRHAYFLRYYAHNFAPFPVINSDETSLEKKWETK